MEIKDVNKRKAERLIKLRDKVYKCRKMYEESVLEIEKEVSKITGLVVSTNYFMDDGFCISVGNEDRNDYMRISTAIEQVLETGTIDPDTPTYY